MNNTEISDEMIKQMEAAEHEMNEKAAEYAWNILDLGTSFNKEEYDKIKKEQLSPNNFTNFDVPTRLLNMTMLIQGYGNFGRKFLESVFDKDRESCINMFESVTQEYLELDAAVKEHIQNIENSIKNSKESN